MVRLIRLSSSDYEPELSRAPEANARLTSMAGVALFVLLAALGFTIIGIHRLITAHAFIGLLLLGPLAVKMGSTGWRFLRYYAGDEAYVRAGPPQPLLRMLAPFVALTTIAVFGSGIGLLLVKPASEAPLVAVHKASFVLWFVVMTVHVLAYAPRAARRALADLARRGPADVIANRPVRLLVVATSLAAGVALGVAGIGWIHPWASWFASRQGFDR